VTLLAKELALADVVVVGEYHGHHGAHLLQYLIQSALYRQRPQQVLSMEQFTLGEQSELDKYLAGQTGEEEMIIDANAWSNYKASYRPLVEFAKSKGLPVIAANAPAAIVRCVGRKGEIYLSQIEESQRAKLPDNAFLETPAYRKKFFDAMGAGHGSDGNSSNHSERLENSFKAQLLRDNTMADRIIRALDNKPGHQIIHLTGTFHSEERLGMVAVLEKKRPDLKIAVVSPIFWRTNQNPESLVASHREKGDFLYFLQPLPVDYTSSERRREAITERFREAAELSCE
jgi:uncharacterized iron-regulated protein